MADETTSGWAARAEALDGLRGYFLRNVTYLALPHEDMVDIGLMSTGAFVDDFVLQHIPTTAVSWPSGIDGVLGPRPGAFPDLFWLQVVGPVDISVVARFLTVAVGK